jgi:hypothetical protein
MTKRGGKTPVITFLKSLIPDAPPLNPLDWMPAPKGTPGYKERQYILKNAKTPAEKALRVARRQWQQLTHGKRIEKVAAENLERISDDPEAVAKRVMRRFKLRETLETKAKYRNEASAADIRRFERLKQKRLEKHISRITAKEVGGALKEDDYKFVSKMARQFEDLDPEFAKYVPEYPDKKRSRGRGKRDAEGRNIRDMKRGPAKARSAGKMRKAA